MAKFNATKYANEYARENYDRMTFQAPKGYKEKVTARAKELGYTYAGTYIKDLIDLDIATGIMNREEIEARREAESKEIEIRKLRQKQEEALRTIEQISKDLDRLGGGKISESRLSKYYLNRSKSILYQSGNHRLTKYRLIVTGNRYNAMPIVRNFN